MCNIKFQGNLVYLELSSQSFYPSTTALKQKCCFKRDLINLLLRQNVHVQITYREVDPSDGPDVFSLTLHDSKALCLLNFKHAAR